MNTDSQWQIETKVEIPRDSIRSAAQRALDDTHRELITLRNITIGLIYFVLAIVNYFTLDAEIAPLMSLAAALTGVAFIIASFYHKNSVYKNHLCNWFLFAEVVVLQLDGMLFLVATSDALNSYGVFVTIMGIGFFASRWIWFSLSVTFLMVSWLAILLLFQHPFELQSEGIMSFSAIITAAFFYYLRLRSAQHQAESRLAQEAYQHKLEAAVVQIETLEGLLPICASCKDIRDDAGNWQQVEAYVGQRTNVEFSHSVCPDCRNKLYPELAT